MSQFIEMFGDQNTNDRGWHESLVKDEFRLTMGKTPARNNPRYWEDGTLKWISISDMAAYDRYTGDTSECITEYAAKDSGIKVVPKGTIIMSFKLSIGRTAITSEDIYTNEAIMAFSDFDASKFNKDFLLFLLSSKNWLLGAKQAVKGQTLNKESIGNSKIIVPPMEKQDEFARIYNQADKSKFVGFKSQFIEMFEFEDLSLLNPSDDFSVKCIDDTSSATKVPAGEYLGNGTYAIYDQSQDCEVAGYTDSHEGLCNNYPAVLFGDHSRVVKYINQPFFIGADGVKIIRPKNDDLLAEFLYYDLLYHNIPNTGYNRHFKYVKMLKLTEASVDRQKAFLGIAHQADKSKYFS